MAAMVQFQAEGVGEGVGPGTVVQPGLFER
jgi:hypothetical protein